MRHIFQSSVRSAKEIRKQSEALLEDIKSEHEKRPYIGTGALAALTFAVAFGIAGGVSSISNENTREDFFAWSDCRQKQRYNQECTSAEKNSYAIVEPQQQKKAWAGSALALTVGFGVGAFQRRRLRQNTPTA